MKAVLYMLFSGGARSTHDCFLADCMYYIELSQLAYTPLAEQKRAYTYIKQVLERLQAVPMDHL